MCGVTVNIAGHCLKMSAVYRQTLSACLPYKDDGPAEFAVESTIEDIESERICITATNPGAIIPDVTIESNILLRKTAERMLDYDTLLIHGAVVAVDGSAFMFTARSGTGKTTRSKLWLEQVPGSYFVNGDKPLLKVQEKDVLACGTPWSGKEKYNTNTMVPLRAIFILERAEKTSLQPLTFSEAFVPLLQQTYRPSNLQLMTKTLDLLKQLDGKVKFYRYKSSLDDADMNWLYQTAMNQSI